MLVMLLFLFFHFLTFSKALPISDGPLEGSFSQTHLNPLVCSDLDNCRRLSEIVWSCVTTILACTWLSIHPNIPGPTDNRGMTIWQRCSCTIKNFFTNRFRLFLVALLVPEWILCWAIQQRFNARQVVEYGGLFM
jgi:hypothetical protein